MFLNKITLVTCSTLAYHHSTTGQYTKLYMTGYLNKYLLLRFTCIFIMNTSRFHQRISSYEVFYVLCFMFSVGRTVLWIWNSL